MWEIGNLMILQDCEWNYRRNCGFEMENRGGTGLLLGNILSPNGREMRKGQNNSAEEQGA